MPDGAQIALAITAGMVTTVNPCGFALLPAYLSAFIGLDTATADTTSTTRGIRQALVVSAAVTAGFATVFGLLGWAVTSLLSPVMRIAPWFTMVLGATLVIVSVFVIAGRQLSIRLPQIVSRRSTTAAPSMYMFGVSYALASVTCALQVFASVTVSASVANFGTRLALVGLFTAGMGIVITTLTVTLACAKAGAVHRFRSAVRHIHRWSAVVMLVAGVYVTYYGWFEYQVLYDNDPRNDWLYEKGSSVQKFMLSMMPHTGNYEWYVAGATLIIAVAAIWARRNERRTPACQLK